MSSEKTNIDQIPLVTATNSTSKIWKPHQYQLDKTMSDHGKSFTNIGMNGENITSISIGENTYEPKSTFFPSIRRNDTSEISDYESSTPRSNRHATTVVLQQSNSWARTSTPAEKYNTRLDMRERPNGDTWSVCSKPTLPSLSEDPCAMDDGQHSTSTLVSKFKMGTNRSIQIRRSSILSGLTISLSAAIFLRLPGLLAIYNPASFLAAFISCLLLVVVPLAFLESGLGQFSSNGVIGIWSLVPFARGVGWSSVVVCLYWGATTAGLGGPWLHYILAYFNPTIFQVSDNSCSLLSNNTNQQQYYRNCVYDYDSASEGTLDLRLEWPLPAGVLAIIFIGFISSMKDPIVYNIVSCIASFMAVTGFIAQSVGIIYYLVKTYSSSVLFQKVLLAFHPNIEEFLDPQLWLSAMSQAIITLGPGIGILLTHSSRTTFRFPLKRKLVLLTFMTSVFTFLICLLSVLQDIVLSNSQVNETSLPTALLVMEDINLMYSESPSMEKNPISSSLEYGMEDRTLTEGTPFVSLFKILPIIQFESDCWNCLLVVLALLGLFGAASATICSVLQVSFVAARETLSLPPAAAGILMMVLLSILTLSTLTKAGAVVLHLFNMYILNTVVLWPPLFGILALSCFHGLKKMRKDLTFMLESSVSVVWYLLWGGVIPLSLLILTLWAFVMSWSDLSLSWASTSQCLFVWVLRFCVVLPIFITAVLVVKSQTAYGLKDKILAAFQSSREWGDWGPKDPIEHHNWRKWREDETRSYASLERRLVSRPLTYTHSTLSSVGTSSLSRIRGKYKPSSPASSI